MSQEPKSVVVIGSGIGGSAIAALLSHRGYKVTVVEKLPFIGGRCCSHKRDGFTLDLGVHTFSQDGVGPLGEVLRRCGREKAIEWSYAKNPTQKLNYLGTIIEYPRGLEKLKTDMNAFQKIMGAVVSMPWEKIAELDEVNVKDWLTGFTRDQVLHNIFSYITELYFVTRYWKASAGEFIRSMQIQAKARASGYPVGGCHVIPESYLKVVTDNGGVVKTKAPAQRIIIENNRAHGVELKDGTVLAVDLVISNAEPATTILELAGRDHFSPEYLKKIEKLELSAGAYVLKLALDKVITDEKFIMQISHPDTVAYYSGLENGEIPERCNLMLPITSNMDPTTAPPGKQLIIAGIFPVYNKDWKRWRRTILDSIKETLPDIEEHILFEEATHTDEVEGLLGEGGGVIGLTQSTEQVGKKRLTQITSVDGLYLVGGEAGGWGIGTELAAMSALELSDMIK